MGFYKRSAVRLSSGGGFSCEVVEGLTMAELVDIAIAGLTSPLRKGQTPDMATARPPLPPLCKGGRTVGGHQIHASRICAPRSIETNFSPPHSRPEPLLSECLQIQSARSPNVRRLSFLETMKPNLTSSLDPGTIVGQIEISKPDKTVAREPDVLQLARSAQGGPAGSLRLEPAARDLSAADPALAQPRPWPRGRVGRPGPRGSRGRVPRGPSVQQTARRIVSSVAPAGDGEQGPQLPAEASAPARRRSRPGRWLSRTAVRPERRPRPRVGPRP